jgi:hypothetical protein
MSRSHRKSSDKRATLTSDESAKVARLLERDETTAIIPGGVLASLIEQAKQVTPITTAPRFEVVELGPEEALVLDDDIFERRWEEVCPSMAS